MVNLASILTSAAAATSLFSTVLAHPGEAHDHAKIKREIEARGLRAAAAKRSLAGCQDTLKHRSLMQRSEERRANTMDELRRKHGITASMLSSNVPTLFPTTMTKTSMQSPKSTVVT